MTREVETVEKIGAKIRSDGDCGDMFCDEETICTCRDHATIALSVIRKIVFEEVEKGIADAQASALSDFTAGKWDALMKLKAALIERLGSGE